MSEEAELALIKLASPAAAIVARRESCSAMPEQSASMTVASRGKGPPKDGFETL